MTDGRMRTRVHTATGWLDFQDYFVRRRCEPVVRELAFEGDAQPQPAFLAALTDPALTAVVICPSNPFISIEPILSLPGVRAALLACRAPVVAVSPIIAGRAVKGPTAKMMTELGLDPSARAVAAVVRRPARRLHRRPRRRRQHGRPAPAHHRGKDADADAGRSRNPGACRSWTPPHRSSPPPLEGLGRGRGQGGAAGGGGFQCRTNAASPE